MDSIWFYVAAGVLLGLAATAVIGGICTIIDWIEDRRQYLNRQEWWRRVWFLD